MVKMRLGIGESDDRRDAEIAYALTWSDTRINELFGRDNVNMPSPVPDFIKEAAADFAAFFCLRNKNVAVAKLYYDTALEDIKDYLLTRHKSKSLL